MIDSIEEDVLFAPNEEMFGMATFLPMIINSNSDGIDGYNEMVSELVYKGSYTYAPKKLDLDLKNKETLPPPTRPSIEETLVLELKALPFHLCYAFLRMKNSFSVIIPLDLLESQVEDLISVL